MKLYLQNWATAVVIGAFLISAVTGVLLFFHLDSGLNKEAHEWLGWALILGVAAHVAVNMGGFKRRFTQPISLAIIGTFVVLLLASFIPLEEEGGGGGPPMKVIVERLAEAPLSSLAVVAGKDVAVLVDELEKKGIDVESPDQSVRDLVGNNHKEKVMTLKSLFD